MVARGTLVAGSLAGAGQAGRLSGLAGTDSVLGEWCVCVQASMLTQNVTGTVGPVTPRIYWQGPKGQVPS